MANTVKVKTFCQAYKKRHGSSRVLLIFCLLFTINAALPSTGLAATYYVDPVNGNDGDAGTSELPWQTIGKAKSTVGAGDTVNLRPGDYGTVTFGETGDSYGTSGNYITYQNDPTSPAYSAKFSQITFNKQNSYLIISGFDVMNVDTSLKGIITTDQASYVKILDLKAHGDNQGNSPSYANIYIRQSQNIIIEDCEVYYAKNWGIQLEDSNNITVRGCHVHDITGSGIRTGGGQDYLIENNIVHTQRQEWNPDIHGSGLSIHTSDTTLRGNIIYDFGNSRPIFFYGGYQGDDGYHDILVENNLVFRRYFNTWGTIPYQNFVQFADVGSNFVIRNNTFTEAVQIGLATNEDGQGLSLYNNIIAGQLRFDGYSRWINVSEGGNIFKELHDRETWTNYSEFSPTSTSIVGGSFDIGVMFDTASGDYPYQLISGSAAIGFGDPTQATATDLLGNSRVFPPDAGAYEYISDPNNSAPVLGAIGNKSVSENTALSFSVSATDADGDTITYSIQNRPTGATFASQSFSWTPSYSQSGSYQVTFIASDGQSQDSETITITVNNVNRTPVLASIGNKSANENNTLSFSVSATDADGDTITYSATGLPTGAAFASQTFTWTPDYSQAGSYQVTFVASDGTAQDSETITITVNNVNRAPVLSTIGSKSVYANDSLTFTVNATDPDGGTVTYSDTGLPSGATFASQSFSWTPGQSQAGSYQVTFIASDSQLQDSETITITVNAADTTAPSVTNYSPEANAIQTPLNNLIVLHVVDTGKGVDANSAAIKVNNNTVYSGNTTNYSSAYGNCRRTGTKADYTFIYQSNELFDFDQTVSLTVNAADLAGNVMSEYSYSFDTEMRSFGKNRKVNSGSDNLSKAGHVTVPDSSGNIWAAWQAGQTGGRDIYVGKLTTGADDFGSSVQLINNTADQYNPAFAIDAADKLYLVWQDNRRGNWDIYISTSSGGTNWSAARRVDDSNDNQVNPAIAIDGSNNAYVVWQDDRGGNQDVYVATSSNDFLTKTVSQITSNSADQTAPAVTVDSDSTVYVVWTDTRGGSNDIYGAASNSSWNNVAIANNASSQSSPAIATEAVGSVLHFLWVDDSPGDKDIYYVSSNGLPGSPLTGSSVIDDSTGADQIAPAIAVTGSTGNSLKVFTSWQDGRNADTDLYFVRINASSGTNVLVGDDSTNSGQSEPAIGTDAYGHPYLIWTDSRNTNTDIYYAASTFTSPSALVSSDVSASSGATVGTDPSAISSIDDVSVVVSGGAIQCDINITISKIKNLPTFAMECLSAYDFGPSGIQFSQPVTVTIPYIFTGSEDATLAYWYNSLTDALSQQGITDVETFVVSSDLHALRFKTTHFTPFYIFSGSVGAASGGGGGGGGGGCSMSNNSEGSIAEFILPYIVLTVAMVILKLRDRLRIEN